jgi:N-acetylneuraminic acid mutarotase
MARSKVFALVLVLVFLTASSTILAIPVSGASIVENTWETKATMSQARAGLGVAEANGKIYAIGGTTASGQYPPDGSAGGFVGTNEEYDPATDTWNTKASMPTPRDYFAIAACQNKIYCIGGAIGFTVDERSGFYSYVTSGVTEVYDAVTNTWVTKKSMPFNGMKICANVVNDVIYVMQGTYVYAYDPINDSWTNKNRMPATPYQGSGSPPVSAVVNNKIIVTGEFQNGYSHSEQKVLIYDTETDSWSEGNSGPTIIINGAAGATTGMKALKRVYVLGLAYGQFPIVPPTNQVYNLDTNTWSIAAAMPKMRMDFGVAVLNDVLYAIGGYYLDDTMHSIVTPNSVNEQYTPIGYGTPDPSYLPPIESNPPVITVCSPVNETYNASSFSLVFTVNKPSNWAGYSLDDKENITVTGNFTLADLPNGLHTLTVYANDTLGNMGVSETLNFTIVVPEQEPEPFPTVPVAAIAVVAVIVAASLLVYNKKHKRGLVKKSELKKWSLVKKP